MTPPAPNVDCPTCGGRLEYIGSETFECLRCSGLLEQSPSAGYRAVATVMDVGGIRRSKL